MLRLIAVLIFLTKCSYAADGKDYLSDYPLDNPSIPSTVWNQKTGCPHLSGRYSFEKGKEVLAQTGDRESVTVKNTGGYIVDWHPRGAEADIRKIIGSDTHPALNPNSFQIAEAGNSFKVIRRWNGATISTIEFDMEQGDYRCDSGWVLLPSRRTKGATEGASYDVYSEVVLTRLTDGGILYKQIYRSSRRDFLFFETTRNNVSFFIFPAE